MDSKKVGFRASAAAAAALFGRTPRSVIETDWCLECFIGFFTSIAVLFFEDRGIGGLCVSLDIFHNESMPQWIMV